LGLSQLLPWRGSRNLSKKSGQVKRHTAAAQATLLGSAWCPFLAWSAPLQMPDSSARHPPATRPP
jgi:hypothetical protein